LGPGSGGQVGGWSSKGSRREAREWWCFLLLAAAGWRVLGSWVWELGLAVGAVLHTIWTEHSASGDKDKGTRERGRERERMKKSSSLAECSTEQRTIAAEERGGGARDKTRPD
jgi:hypothetical protein